MPSRARERFTEPHPNQIAQWFHPLLRKRALQAWAARDADALLGLLGSFQRMRFTLWFAWPCFFVTWGRKWVPAEDDPFVRDLLWLGWDGGEGLPPDASPELACILFEAYPVFADSLPKPDRALTLYRGCRHGGQNGISWTADPSVAYEFTRLRAREGGRIYRAVVPAEDVLSSFGERDEAEYICRMTDRDDIEDVTDELVAAGLEGAGKRWYAAWQMGR